jgi:uncharacterized protein
MEVPRELKVPFDGTYLALGEPPSILGTKCVTCGTTTYGKRESCENCAGTDVKPVALGKIGILWSYTVQRYPPTEPYKLGSTKREDWVPRVVGWVELPEGPRILSIVENCKPEYAKIGMEVEMFVDKGWLNENGDEVMILKGRPKVG